MSLLLDKYRTKIIPQLKRELGLKNDLALPTVEKIVVNCGAADALSNPQIIEKIKEQLAAICGQQPKVTSAKKSISAFKLRAGDHIGVMATLRGKRAWHFLEKFISVVIPRMRDFRGIQETKFDKFGNYSFGLNEQILFPEVDYAKIDRVRGLVVTIVVKNSNPEKSKKFFELLGLPFRKN